jgi:hypothetical protein
MHLLTLARSFQFFTAFTFYKSTVKYDDVYLKDDNFGVTGNGK